jgi:hypothetical protein
MAGNIKFGPDRPGTIDTDEEKMTEDEDWWMKHLQPSANNKDQMVAAIHDYVGAFGIVLRATCTITDMNYP